MRRTEKLDARGYPMFVYEDDAEPTFAERMRAKRSGAKLGRPPVEVHANEFLTEPDVEGALIAKLAAAGYTINEIRHSIGLPRVYVEYAESPLAASMKSLAQLKELENALWSGSFAVPAARARAGYERFDGLHALIGPTDDQLDAATYAFTSLKKRAK